MYYTKAELNWIVNNKNYHRVGLYQFLKDCNPNTPIKESLKRIASNCADIVFNSTLNRWVYTV